MQCQWSRSPLILFNSTIIMCIQQCKFFSFHYWIRLQIQSWGINVGNNHINTALYIISDNYRNNIFISIVKINFIPLFQFTFFINIDKSIFYKLFFCQIYKFTLSLCQIQIFFIVFSKFKYYFFLFICITFPQIFLCHFTSFPKVSIITKT